MIIVKKGAASQTRSSQLVLPVLVGLLVVLASSFLYFRDTENEIPTGYVTLPSTSITGDAVAEGGICTATSDCQSGLACRYQSTGASSKTCKKPQIQGGYCRENSDCPSTLACRKSGAGQSSSQCYPLAQNTAYCDEHSDCANDICYQNRCTADLQCQIDLDCAMDYAAAGQLRCDTTTSACVRGTPNLPSGGGGTGTSARDDTEARATLLNKVPAFAKGRLTPRTGQSHTLGEILGLPVTLLDLYTRIDDLNTKAAALDAQCPR